MVSTARYWNALLLCVWLPSLGEVVERLWDKGGKGLNLRPPSGEKERLDRLGYDGCGFGLFGCGRLDGCEDQG